jgi:hypothetical protein
MAPSPGPCIFPKGSGRDYWFLACRSGFAFIASDEDHRCDEEECCTDHQNIQGMCESHGDLLALTVRYYDRKNRIEKVFCCCVATSVLGQSVIHRSNAL